MINSIPPNLDFESNLLLYFFSAMPQVIGTMLALVGAFYLTRSESIRREIYEEIEGLRVLIERLRIGLSTIKLTSEQKILLEKLENLARVTVITTHLGVMKGNIDDIRKAYRESLDSEKSENKYQDFGNQIMTKVFTINSKLKVHGHLKRAIKMVYQSNGVILGILILFFILLPTLRKDLYLIYMTLSLGILLSIIAIYSLVDFSLYAISNVDLPYSFNWRNWKTLKNIQKKIWKSKTGEL